MESALVGQINVYNILLACSVAFTYGLSEEAIQKGLSKLATSSGEI